MKSVRNDKKMSVNSVVLRIKNKGPQAYSSTTIMTMIHGLYIVYCSMILCASVNTSFSFVSCFTSVA